MKSTLKWSTALCLIGSSVVLSVLATSLYVKAQTQRGEIHMPFHIIRVYTGADGLSHAKEMEADFGANNVFKMLPVTGAELHRAQPGNVGQWHVGPQRQYVITLRGRAEIEVAGGRKFISEPGHIDLIEDTTGKGHITRNLGPEERVTLWLPLADQHVNNNDAAQ